MANLESQQRRKQELRPKFQIAERQPLPALPNAVPVLSSTSLVVPAGSPSSVAQSKPALPSLREPVAPQPNAELPTLRSPSPAPTVTASIVQAVPQPPKTLPTLPTFVPPPTPTQPLTLTVRPQTPTTPTLTQIPTNHSPQSAPPSVSLPTATVQKPTMTADVAVRPALPSVPATQPTLRSMPTVVGPKAPDLRPTLTSLPATQPVLREQSVFKNDLLFPSRTPPERRTVGTIRKRLVSDL